VVFDFSGSSIMRSQQWQRGFNLVELMIVIAVIATLSAIAIPQYQEHLRKSRRAECESVLMTIATALERTYSVAGKYQEPGNMSTTCPAGGGGAVYYGVTLDVSDDQSFVLLAAPKTEGRQDLDVCGALALDNKGGKHAAGKGQVSIGTLSPSTLSLGGSCWK
jgi:type IV pilus assembly protein PilE